jgi:uncharacterized protein (DUF2141 family)
MKNDVSLYSFDAFIFMVRSKLRQFIYFTVIVLAAIACAKISAPSGGPRDRKPPVVEESRPLNGTKNFHGKKIEVTFDEFVVLDNINEKFMVSPPMKKKPRVFMRGKKLDVEYDEALRDSTTYTFYFLDAIRDLNEGNILENYKFVVSTGNVIDSLSVTGNVYNSLSLEVPEKTTVFLYRDQSDSAVIKSMPDYLSRVDLTGYFRIDNVRPGTYKLYAIKDDDNSKTYNRTEELFGFLDTTIVVTPEKNYILPEKDTVPKQPVEKKPVTTATRKPAGTAAGKAQGTAKTQAEIPEIPAKKGEYKLIVFQAEKKDHYLVKSARDIRNKLLYVLSLPPDTMKFDFSIPGVAEDKYLIERSRSRDTLTVWLTDSTVYSQPQISTVLRYPFTDTLKVLRYKQDTISMRFTPPRATKAKAKKRVLVLENNIVGGLKPGQKITFTAQTPVREPDTTKIRLYEMVEKSRSRIPYSISIDPTLSSRYVVDARMAEGKQYLFVADSAAFRDIYNDANDSTGIRFEVRKADSYGTLVVNVKNSEGNCILQLLNSSDKVITEKKIKADGKTEFPLLEKGTYRLRAVFDINGDGKWTTGDFLSHRQPEPVTYFDKELTIKEGWVDEEQFDLTPKNFKDQKLRAKPKT